MKRTLEALVVALAISAPGCATSSNLSPSYPLNQQAADGKYDSVDDYVNDQEIQGLKDASYMILNQSTYKTQEGKEIILQKFGTSIIYRDVDTSTYLVTANHVMQNEEVLHDFFGREYKKISEKCYILDDNQVAQFQKILRKSSEVKDAGKLYLKDSSGIKRKLQNTVQVSSGMDLVFEAIKAKEVRTAAYNQAKDLAIVSTARLNHKPLAYSMGNSDEVQTQNIIYVIGWPLGLTKNVNQGHISSVNDSVLARDDPETNFIFDASISPGNSGGPIFAVRDGKFELVGITSADRGGNDIYVGIKVKPVTEVFKGNSIHCSEGWKCNPS